ncbi:OB-fold putative lipoprotein [Roseivirga pacifica]|uniref:OB-fold putative lipoprotein n=1 Tax=Roseivirga pacifica TaxID=1267423 RepID=UPI0020940583|nr:OB-fold putative lipoprotein [Roseivirga pacifica]MCO6360571.1 hypothetical protein [Roseivirga pacifica]MCO6368460.1 hypothetical protein [Roseivirga pacifica]MCO6372602.1 hypothetical protein [Roseivirga pacifica]MCO6376660.1 hypothetical protein [Roseivirga pacifica]MCO6378060.1 hypothetical protein [Roseivirga pacifica]
MQKRRLILSLIFIIGIVAGYFVYQKFLSTSPGMAKQKAVAEVTAIDVYAAFEADESAANQQYLNQVIQVSGSIAGVERPADANPVITLETTGFGLVKCTLEPGWDEAQLHSLSTGDQITLKGECIGLLLDLLINNAIIIQP